MEKSEKYNKMPEKLTCTGESIVAVQKREKEKDDFIVKMFNDISKAIESDLQNHEFYVIHMNYHYERPIDDHEKEYCPAEIAIAHFTLKDGIKRTFHAIPSLEFAKGYLSEARDRSLGIHQIPSNTQILDGEKDYKELYDKIVAFLNPSMNNGRFPMLFTRHTGVKVDCGEETIKSVFKHMFAANEEAGAGAVNSQNDILVYSLEILGGQMIGIDHLVVGNLLDQTSYQTCKSIQCELHASLGVGKNCSLSIVQRWIFAIFNEYNKKKTLKMMEGKHYPIQERSENIDNNRGAWQEIPNNRVRSSQPLSGSTSSPRGGQQEAWVPTSERTYLDEQRRRQEAEGRTLEIQFQGVHIGHEPQSTFSSRNSNVLNDGEFPALGSRPGGRRPRQNNAPKNWAATVKK